MVQKNSRSPSRTIVQKYGGSSLATPQQIQAAAARVGDLRRQGYQMIVVVSAMGKTTDQLLDLAYMVSPQPNRRELDMLLSTGERISMALMSMALNDHGCPAISFTGSQAGVMTDDLHSNARIIDVRPIRIEAELHKDQVIVLAGFQGVHPDSKEITTLGRGGSDTTAVAMAAAFNAERCEIRKDVDGVYSGDPNKVKNAAHLPTLDYSAMLDFTFWGAKVLHYRSVELAAVLQIPIVIALAHGEGRATVIRSEKQEGAQDLNQSKTFERTQILSINSHADAKVLRAKVENLGAAFADLEKKLNLSDLPLPQFLDAELLANGQCALLVTAPKETLNAICQHLAQPSSSATETQWEVEPATFATVTATCQGAFASNLPGTLTQSLKDGGIAVHKLIFGAMSITAVLHQQDREKAVQNLHSLIQP